MSRSIVMLCLAALFLGESAFAQNANGSIGGTVTDPANARVPGATINAVNVDTNIKHSSVSTDSGDYQVMQLPPGTYDIAVEATGFKTAQRKSIRVQVADRLTLNFSLEVGSLAETVVVTSEAPLLRTEDAQVGQIIDSLMIQNLPQINRNPLDLMRLSGNVSGSGRAVVAGSPEGTNSDSTTTINGGRTSGAEYLVDGASIMTGKSHAASGTAIPTMETVAEFKVITNGISAEYGRASGGVVELATKSGTNQLHGQAFEYFWNEHLNANSWQQNSVGASKGAFHRNTYGFVVGGPVFVPKIYNGKNKTFFLFNFEQQKFRRAGSLQLYMAPTDEEREGDMTNMLYAGSHAMMWDPLGTIIKDADGNFIKQTPLGGDGLHVPASRIDPAAKRIMSYLPRQNRAPTPGYSDQNAYAGSGGNLMNVNNIDVRLDHSLTEKQHAYLRLKHETFENVQKQWYSPLSPDDGRLGRGARAATLAWNYTLTPTTILTLRGSLTHNPTDRRLAYDFDMADWELDPLLKSMQRNIPTVNWHTWNANSMGWGDMLGGTNAIPSADSFTNGTVAASVSKIYNKHTLKFGFETRRFYDNHYEDFPATLTYTGVAVASQNYGDPTWSNGNTGFANSWGGFLLGIPDNASKTALYTMANSSNYYAAYVQDDIKVNSRLTVNVGLRWDMETPMTERHDKLFAWDPDAPSAWNINSGWNWNDQLTKAGLTAEQIGSIPVPRWAMAGKFPNGAAFYAGTPEHPSRTMQGYNPWNFAPRLGVAYQINPKTVLRSSFTKMFLTTTGNYWASWVSGADSVSSSVYDRNASNGNIDHNHMDLWYPDQYVAFSPQNEQLNRTLGSQIGTTRMLSTKAEMPAEYAWSFYIQRQLPASTVLEVGYAGNHSGTLLATERTSVFPANLIQPQYYSLFTKNVDNPVAGQVQNVGLTTGDQIPLGYMMMSNPLFGGIEVDGNNIGRSNYNAFNLKLEKRLSHGVAFLLAYTFSKALDNVGGVDRQAYKPFQSFQTVDDVYGLSPIDETHRLTFYHDVQLPIGKGRRFFHSPASTGSRIIEKIVGGWEYAGTALIRSGRPLWFGPSQGNQFENAGVPSLWGRMVSDPGNPNYQNDLDVLRSANDAQAGTSRFNGASFISAQQAAEYFVLSNISPVYNGIRQPGSTSYDGALMKSFSMFREGTFLQVRMEAENLFNIRGFGTYNTQYDNPGFGFITAVCGTRDTPCSASPERKIQVSARFVF